MTAAFQSGADAFDGWKESLLTGKPPVLFPIGTGDLERLELGPGLVWLLGGAPGAGKTAFSLQAVIDALRLTPTLRALVANVEMPPGELLNRQLARLSGVNLTAIRKRQLTAEHAERIDQGLNTLEPLADRLAFLRPPFDLSNVADSADAFGTDLLLLDYIQRFPPPGDQPDGRHALNKTMDFLRQFADAGLAVIVVSAIGRTKDSKGRNSYDGEGLNLASFRESSELEFGADDAFILTPAGEGEEITLRHLKSRYGECRDLALAFDRVCQRFTLATGTASNGKGSNGKPSKSKSEAARIAAELASLWASTPPAAEGEGGEG